MTTGEAEKVDICLIECVCIAYRWYISIMQGAMKKPRSAFPLVHPSENLRGRRTSCQYAPCMRGVVVDVGCVCLGYTHSYNHRFLDLKAKRNKICLVQVVYRPSEPSAIVMVM
jgi:hypothetical protein